MTIDATFEFEKRRNIPVRYDRELVQTTMKAMKRVAEIKKRREHMFWKHRMMASREKMRAARAKRLGQHMVKLVQPISGEKEKIREKVVVTASKRPSALVEASGRSMGMVIDG